MRTVAATWLVIAVVVVALGAQRVKRAICGPKKDEQEPRRL